MDLLLDVRVRLGNVPETGQTDLGRVWLWQVDTCQPHLKLHDFGGA